MIIKLVDFDDGVIYRGSVLGLGESTRMKNLLILCWLKLIT